MICCCHYASVAGVYTPAFVERDSGPANPYSYRAVSPGFILRPSLSVDGSSPSLKQSESSVAGVYTPAFVERATAATAPSPEPIVSPGFILRPSLSERRPLPQATRRYAVSPGFILRPSLSVRKRRRGATAVPRVSPGFILRPSLSDYLAGGMGNTVGACVAGVYTPAFVERSATLATCTGAGCACRRGLYSGLR